MDSIQRLDGLQLSFRAAHDFDLPDVGADAYFVEFKCERGDEVLRLKLPTEIVERAVLSVTQPFLTISPDGWLLIQYMSVADEPPTFGRVAIDTIIEQAIAPPMLEDEPTADTMLEELRSRLKRALDMVEATIARI